MTWYIPPCCTALSLPAYVLQVFESGASMSAVHDCKPALFHGVMIGRPTRSRILKAYTCSLSAQNLASFGRNSVQDNYSNNNWAESAHEL